jgi:hypothetical protein
MPTPYRVVAANLDSESIDEADRIARILKDEGWPRATRSLRQDSETGLPVLH